MIGSKLASRIKALASRMRRLYHSTTFWCSLYQYKGMRTAKEEDNIRFLIQAKTMRNDVSDAKIKIKRRMK